MKLRIFITLLWISFTILSCDSRFTPVPADKTDIEDLAASDNFDWKTSENITLHVDKPSAGVIKITSLDGTTIYHKGYHKGYSDESKPTYNVSVNLPKYVETIRVNSQEVEITGEEIDVNLSDNSLVLKNAQLIKNNLYDDCTVAWKLDENEGSIAADKDGGNKGEIYGAEWVPGISGSALDFNGTDGTVRIPFNQNINITGEEASFSLWFKRDNLKDDGAVLFQVMKFIFKIDKHGKVAFALYNPEYTSVSTSWSERIMDTQWHHIVATYDGEFLRLYIDSELKGTKETSGLINNSDSDIYIGGQRSINFFEGCVDEVALYSKALTPDEVATIYDNTFDSGNEEGSLISEWNFDENSGTTANDNVSSNNGEVLGAEWDKGFKNSSLKFDGTSDFVKIPREDNLNLSKEVTLLAWARTNENKTAKIAQKGDWDGYSIYQDKWKGWKCAIALDGGGGASVDWGNGRPEMGKWYHIAMTYDGEELKLFINGQLKDSEEVSGELRINSRDFSIGSDNGKQKFFNGNIDEVKLYGKALTFFEIQDIYNNTESNNVTDSDGDGVQDSEEEFPNDESRAFTNYLPASGFGSLAFEDLWPGKGDYDFNDLVLDYRFQTITNSSNYVTEIIGSFVVRAIGAGYRNGFGFQLPNNNVEEDDVVVSGYQLSENYINLKDNGTEDGQEKTTIIVFDNSGTIMESNSGFGANVHPSAPYIEPDTITLSILLTPNKYKVTDIDLFNFNPFLIVDKNRGKEIHLPDYAPTSLCNPAYFGETDDDSNPAIGRYYKTSKNLPWAINIPESFEYPIEKIKITKGHLKFYEWVTSSGNDFSDWYQNKEGYRDDSNIYTHE